MNILHIFALNLKVPVKTRSTRTSRRAGEPSNDPVPVPKSPDTPKPSVSVSISKLLLSTALHHIDEPSSSHSFFISQDHHYALDPDQIKIKLSEAQARVEHLERQLRNAKDRERRQKQAVKSLLDDLRNSGVISDEFQLKLTEDSGRFSSFKN